MSRPATQSDQGFHYLSTESLYTVEYMYISTGGPYQTAQMCRLIRTFSIKVYMGPFLVLHII